MSNSTADLAIRDALEMYTDLGFEAIPLRPDSKEPLARAWQTRPINRLWRDVPGNVNIGLRGGGLAGAAFIDCDEKSQAGTFKRAQQWLAGLGYLPGEYPVVSTATGIGRHIYVTFGGGLPGSVRKLAPDFGAGEFRYGPGGYVAAPPSRISGAMQYRLLEGDLRQLPQLGVQDVLPVLGNQDLLPIPVLRMSRKASAVLHGKNLDGYGSRSEADAMLIASLINSKYPFEAVLELFEPHPTSGKYHELKVTKGNKAALHYLRRTYTEVSNWTQDHDSKARRKAAAAINWALCHPWPGRTGAVDRVIFLAHMQIAQRAGRLTWAASCRDLALLAGMNSAATAAKANERLCDAGLIVLQTKAVGDCANMFRLSPALDKLEHSPSTPAVRKCTSLSPSHDAFRYRGLGKSAEHIWQMLQEAPATAHEIAERTGRCRRTIRRTLVRMERFTHPLTGELLPMVAKDASEYWHTLTVDLDQVARAVGTGGRGDRQVAEIAKDRQMHRRSLLRSPMLGPGASASGDDKKV